jgi:hypothetical protein
VVEVVQVRVSTLHVLGSPAHTCRAHDNTGVVQS